MTSPIVISKRKQPTPTLVYDTYWRFAVERQAIFMRRVRGDREPWTRDEILKEYKFTNAYRAADRVSQYLISSVIYDADRGLRDTVLRILLFKLFNKIDTWMLIEETLGEVTESTFCVETLDRVLSAALESGASIYSAAYIMPSGPTSVRTPRKHLMHLRLVSNLMREYLPERLVQARTMESAYALLLSIPGIGPFLAYQFVIDLNYSPYLDMSEMEFVVPGPGARDGLRKCFKSFGDYDEADVIRWVTERQEMEFSTRGLSFESLWGRPLQLIDCQNLFCEVDKYARVKHPDVLGHSGRTRIKQRFAPTGGCASPFFPPKWNLNDKIALLQKSIAADQRG